MELIPFNYEGTAVRAVIGNDGEPRFVLADLCHVLKLGNTSMVARRLSDSMKGLSQIDTPGGSQRMTTVTEAGMYAVVMRSDKPEAVRFQEWVTGEVLPSIRKRGGYLTPEATEKALTDPDFIIQLATSLKEERAKRAALEAENEANKPKVLFADAVATSHASILVGDLAKLVQQNGIPLGANRLFKWLRKHGYLISRKGTDWNMPTQKAQELGLFRVKETAVTHPDGHVTVNRTPKVTGKGQEYFISRFLDGRFDIASDIESR